MAGRGGGGGGGGGGWVGGGEWVGGEGGGGLGFWKGGGGALCGDVVVGVGGGGFLRDSGDGVLVGVLGAAMEEGKSVLVVVDPDRGGMGGKVWFVVACGSPGWGGYVRRYRVDLATGEV